MSSVTETPSEQNRYNAFRATSIQEASEKLKNRTRSRCCVGRDTRSWNQAKKRTWPLCSVRAQSSRNTSEENAHAHCALFILWTHGAKHKLNSEHSSTLSLFKHKFNTNGVFSLVSRLTLIIYLFLLLLLLLAVVVFFKNSVGQLNLT